MIIYEVNLTIDKQIIEEFYQWLKEHVNEMLKLPGFTRAEIFKERKKDAISVRYHLEHSQHLENYLNYHAKRMRDEGVKKFKDRFFATRRILSLTHTSVEQ